MAKLVAVDKGKMKKGLDGLQHLLDNDPAAKKEHDRQQKEFEERIAAEKKHRDDKHRTRTGSPTDS